MKIKYIIGAGLFSMSFMATGAQATDWSGIYVGAHSGYSFYSMDNLPHGISSEPSGFSGGLHAGYQLQLGAVILGVEGAYTALNIDDFGFTNLNNGVSTARESVGDVFSAIDLGDINLQELINDNSPMLASVGEANPALDINNIDLTQFTDGPNPTLAGVGGTSPAFDIGNIDLTQFTNGTPPVLAVRTGLSRTSNTGELSYPAPNQETDKFTAGVSDIFTVVARGGFAFGKMMTYGKIGYATAGIGFSNMLNPTPASLLNFVDRENGLLLGAGTEFAITDRISMGIDYTYINFGIDSNIQDLNFATLPSVIETNLDNDHHQVNVRLNFRFN